MELARVSTLVSLDANEPATTSVLVLCRLGEGLQVTGEVAIFLLCKNHELEIENELTCAPLTGSRLRAMQPPAARGETAECVA